jgi:hypothetical protein
VVEPLVHRGRGDTFVVPAGFRTDFATVPRLIVWLIPRLGLPVPAQDSALPAFQSSQEIVQS